MTVRAILVAGLAVVALAVIVALLRAMSRHHPALPRPLELAIGFVTDFLDTLGIGSFAPTVSMFKFWRLVPDERIPGTLNIGHAIPTIVEALIFISIVKVDPKTLVLFIVAAIAGAWLGAGAVARWPRRYVQIGMSAALLVAGLLFTMSNLHLFPAGGAALSLDGARLWFGVAANCCLGALMTLGIGLYAPCLILVSMLGMNPLAAFPIMMGSCAFLMPVASIRFIRLDAFSMRAALGLTLGGIPGVLIAAFIVKHLPLVEVRWLVIVVVVYAAVVMLRSAIVERAGSAANEYAVTPRTLAQVENIGNIEEEPRQSS